MTATSPLAKAASNFLLVPFQKLLDKRAFGAIEEAMYNESNKEALCLWLEEDMYGESNHRHPLNVTDAWGRTPLHLAVAHRSSSIVPMLTHGLAIALQPTLVTAPLVLDALRRSPLHWACTNARPHYSHRGSTSKGFSGMLKKVMCFDQQIDMVDAVQILLDVYPEAVNLRDVKGFTPLDLALANDADPCIIKLVQTALRQVNAKKHKTDEPFYAQVDESSRGDVLYSPRSSFMVKTSCNAEVAWIKDASEYFSDDTFCKSSMSFARNGKKSMRSYPYPYVCVEV